jgi:DNA-binding NarL/FixJ family response regulator
MGNRAEFDRLVEAVYAYVYTHIPDRPSAEMLTERVFLQAWGDLRPGSRSRRGLLRRLYGLADAALTGDRPSRTASLPRALATLSSDERQVLVLRFGQGLEVAAIAELLAIDEHTVRRLQLRALRALRASRDSASGWCGASSGSETSSSSSSTRPNG